ncbi:MAG TPA: DMT family transporter [Steroidobacteraceae bacterium]|nr:DMT family transporter [Steroidobacteraceae bacterium]
MVLLCLIWGLQQVAIKAAGADVPPALQVALRSGGSGLLVWLFSRVLLRERWRAGVAAPGLVAGVLFAGEFLFLAEGLRLTTASHIVVFLYTAPVFAAIGLHLALPEERLGRLQWAGIALAFLGIAVTFLGPRTGDAAAPAGWLAGDLLGVCAGAAWGLSTVAIRVTRLSEAPAAQTLFIQLAVACVLLLPFAALTGQVRFHGSLIAWGSLGFQTVIVSFASYLAWFELLRRYLAARLGVLSFMTPMFGVAAGALLLHEPLERSFLAGAVLVMLGLLVVNARAWLRSPVGSRGADLE